MGQPSAGLSLRVGRSQLWAHSTTIALTSPNYAEQMHRLYEGERFSRLVVQTLI